MYLNPKYCTVTMITQRNFALNYKSHARRTWRHCVALHQCLLLLVTNSSKLSAGTLPLSNAHFLVHDMKSLLFQTWQKVLGHHRQCIQRWDFSYISLRKTVVEKYSADIKCKQLHHLSGAAPFLHYSTSTLQFYWKSDINNESLRLNNHHLCLLCSVWRNSPWEMIPYIWLCATIFRWTVYCSLDTSPTETYVGSGTSRRLV